MIMNLVVLMKKRYFNYSKIKQIIYTTTIIMQDNSLHLISLNIQKHKTILIYREIHLKSLNKYLVMKTKIK